MSPLVLFLKIQMTLVWVLHPHISLELFSRRSCCQAELRLLPTGKFRYVRCSASPVLGQSCKLFPQEICFSRKYRLFLNISHRKKNQADLTRQHNNTFDIYAHVMSKNTLNSKCIILFIFYSVYHTASEDHIAYSRKNTSGYVYTS